MAVYTWRPANGGDLGLAADWTFNGTQSAAVPGPADAATFDASGGPVTGSVTGTATIDTLGITIGATAPWIFTGRLTANTALVESATTMAAGAVLRLRGTSSGFLPLAGQISAPVTLDASFLAAAAGELLVGAVYSPISASGASLVLQNAASANVLTLHIGAGAAGAVSITGPGSFLSAVGDAADGGNITIGQQATANGVTTSGNGSLTLTGGGTAGADAGLNIGGDAGSTGGLTINAFSTFTLKGGAAYVGSGAGSTGTLTINAGGTFTAEPVGNFALLIGSSLGGFAGTGSVLVQGSGALLDLSNGAALVGEDGTGTLTVSSGGTARVGEVGPAKLGLYDEGTSLSVGTYQYDPASTVTVTGINSSLTLSGLLTVGGNGTVDVSDGGTLNATESNLPAGEGSVILGTLNITAGGVAFFGPVDLGVTTLVSGANSALNAEGVFGNSDHYSTLTINDGGVVRDAATAASGGAKSGLNSVSVTGPGSVFDLETNSIHAETLSVTDGGILRSAGPDTVANPVGLTTGVGTIYRYYSGPGFTVASPPFLNITSRITVDSAGSVITAVGIDLATGDTTTLTVQNGGLFIQSGAQSTDSLTIGDAGYAVYPSETILDPGTTISNTGFVEYPGETILDPGTATVLVQTGGDLVSRALLSIGIHDSTATVTVQSDGMIEAATTLLVGGETLAPLSPAFQPSSNGTLNVLAGGTAKTDGGAANGVAAIVAGQSTTSTGLGLINVEGASAVLDSGGQRIDIGSSAAGGLSVSAGGQALAGSTGYTDSEAAFAVGGSAGSIGTVIVTGAGSGILVSGQAVLGGDNTGSGLAAGGTATLYATAGGRFRATSLAMFAGSTVNLEGTGNVVVGSSAGTAGKLTVDAASIVTGAGAIHATVLDNGTITAAGGTLALDALDAASTGTAGTAGAELDIATFDGGALQYGLGSGTIKLGTAGTANVAVTGFLTGDTLDFGGTTATIAGNTVHLANGAIYSFAALAPNTGLAAAADGHDGTTITTTTLVNTLAQLAQGPAFAAALTASLVGSAATADPGASGALAPFGTTTLAAHGGLDVAGMVPRPPSVTDGFVDSRPASPIAV